MFADCGKDIVIEMYKFNRDVHAMRFEQYVILCNVKTGSYVRLPESYYHAMLSLDLDEKKIIKHKALYGLFCKLIEMGCIEEDDVIGTETNLETVYVSVTNRCNLKCIHCCTDADNSCEDSLSTEMLLNIVDKIIDLSPEEICFTGGEPLVRKDILRILKYTREKFAGTITLSTNGTLIHSENVDEIIAYVNHISISFDGYDEYSCSLLRGTGIFAKCCSTVELLHEHHFRNLSLSMVLTKDTYQQKEKFEELCAGYDAETVVRRLQPQGRGREMYHAWKDEIWKDENELSVGCRTCFPGNKECHISFDGSVYPCGGTFGIEEFVIANILDADFKEIWRKQKNNHELSCLSPYRSWNCSECKNCTIQLFCPICIGEKYVLLKGKYLEEEFCRTYREKMEKRLKKELFNG